MVTTDLPLKSIVVTGALGGLGLAISEAILQAGSDAICFDLAPQPPESVWNDLTSKFTNVEVQASYHQCDVTKEKDVEAALAWAREVSRKRHRPVRGMVSCAGVQKMHDAEDFPTEEFRRILDVNVTGTFLMAKHVARLMKEKPVGGSIVLIASIAGYVANRGVRGAAYCASKAAVHSLSRALAVEWGRYGIRVNSLSPGPIKTRMVEQLLEEDAKINNSFMTANVVGHLGAPEDVQAATVYLLSDKASYVTGADLRIDGGMCASV